MDTHGTLLLVSPVIGACSHGHLAAAYFHRRCSSEWGLIDIALRFTYGGPCSFVRSRATARLHALGGGADGLYEVEGGGGEGSASEGDDACEIHGQ